MERTINKMVKAELERAKNAPKLVRNILPNPGAIEIVWTNPQGGTFVAQVTMRAVSPQGVAFCAADFANWINNEWLPRQARVAAPPPAANGDQP